MKVVHVIHSIADDEAFCGKEMDYVAGHTGHGWSAAYHMSKYHINNPVPWKWCEECLTTSDYALFVLGDLP